MPYAPVPAEKVVQVLARDLVVQVLDEENTVCAWWQFGLKTKRGNSETEELQISTQNAQLVFAWTFGVLFDEDGLRLRVSYST